MELHEPAVEGARRRILLVEDEPLIRAMLAEELRAEGFVVIEACGASEALAFFTVDHGLDLVFTDVHMPGSLDGIKLAERIHELHPSLPVVLTSGNPPPVSLGRHGRFIRKPYIIGDAVKLVAEILSDEKGRG